MTTPARKINAANATREYVYADRASGVPSFQPDAIKKYTEREADAIERNFTGTGTTLRPLVPLDRIRIAIGYREIKTRVIHRVTFKGRKGYHEHLNGLSGFVAVMRGAGEDRPKCFREDGTSMHVIIIDDELIYDIEETLWPQPFGLQSGESGTGRKGGRGK